MVGKHQGKVNGPSYVFYPFILNKLLNDPMDFTGQFIELSKDDLSGLDGNILAQV